MLKNWILGIASAMLVPVLAFGAENNTVQEPVTKKSFPKEISFSNKTQPLTLKLTGVAARKKFFINIYAAGHYMQDPVFKTADDVYPAILTDGKAKEFIFNWARGATSQQVKDGFIESFHKVLSENEFEQLKPEIDQFLSFYNQDIQANDQQEIRWLRGGNIEVVMNGVKKGTITSIPFAKALWNVWLGPKGVLKREKLVEFITTEDGKKVEAEKASS